MRSFLALGETLCLKSRFRFFPRLLANHFVSGISILVSIVLSPMVLLLRQVNPAIDSCLPLVMSEVLGANVLDREERGVAVLSCLIKHGAGPTPRQLSLVGNKAGFVATRKCLLDAVCSAVNPLLVGMRLSLLLADAAGMGNEGQRQVCCCWCGGCEGGVCHSDDRSCLRF